MQGSQERGNASIMESAVIDAFLMARPKLLLDTDTRRYLVSVTAQNCGLEHGLNALQNTLSRLSQTKSA